LYVAPDLLKLFGRVIALIQIFGPIKKKLLIMWQYYWVHRPKLQSSVMQQHVQKTWQEWITLARAWELCCRHQNLRSSIVGFT